jgi:prepilin-type N-terminal cleavage/methylation domain-containing protein
MMLARFDIRRLRPTRESGFTLVELAVAMAVMGIVTSIFLGALASVQRSMVRESGRSATMDQARLAVEALDREIRSGRVLCESATGSNPYYTLSVYTRNAFSPTITTSRWVQYKVANQQLQRREYGSTSWQPWRIVADGIVNVTPASTTTDVPFKLNTSSSYGAGSTLGSRVVDVTLVVNTAPSDTTASSVRLVSSMTIRNQASATNCSSIPAG